MKLNKILLAGSLAVMGGALSSCDTDWLEILPKTDDTIEVYYVDDAKIQEALTAAYDPMHWLDYANNYTGLNVYPEVLADVCYPGGGDANDMSQYKGVYNMNVSTTQVLTTNWENCYSGVKRCNDVLYYMEHYWIKDAEHGWTQEKENYYRSQVLTLRVFFYNQLWHWWGNIVYYTENLTGSNGYTGVQYTEDEVYEFMMKDLEEVIAANNLEWKAPAGMEGHITMPMVYMLYTEIVMMHNDGTPRASNLDGDHPAHTGTDAARMSKALDYMKKIIESPEYDLVDDYASIWDVTGEWCKESLFEINYSSFQANRGWSWGGVCGGTVVPAMIGPRGYDGSDGIHNGNGWGFGTVRASFYNSFDANDTRRDASIWAPAPGTYTIGYQDTGYFLAKYAPMDKNNQDATGDKTLNYNNNLRLYRYSEALLNAAELVVRGAGSGDAQGWLDQVRKRAGLGSVPATLDNILQERKFEFVGEGKRYWDILRTAGMAEKVLVPDNELAAPEQNRQNAYTPNKRYLPFSDATLSRSNNSIKQNPYYD